MQCAMCRIAFSNNYMLHSSKDKIRLKMIVHTFYLRRDIFIYHINNNIPVFYKCKKSFSVPENRAQIFTKFFNLLTYGFIHFYTHRKIGSVNLPNLEVNVFCVENYHKISIFYQTGIISV